MSVAEDLLISQEDENIQDMYLIFTVNGESYGVPIGVVTEIVGLQKIVEVPDMPGFIKGVINLRSQVIPVMDVRARFNMPDLQYNDRTVIIVLEHKSVKTGLIVDGVNDVCELSDSEMSTPPASQIGKGKGLINQIGQKESAVYFILDIERLLNTD